MIQNFSVRAGSRVVQNVNNLSHIPAHFHITSLGKDTLWSWDHNLPIRQNLVCRNHPFWIYFEKTAEFLIDKWSSAFHEFDNPIQKWRVNYVAGPGTSITKQLALFRFSRSGVNWAFVQQVNFTFHCSFYRYVKIGVSYVIWQRHTDDSFKLCAIGPK